MKDLDLRCKKLFIKTKLRNTSAYNIYENNINQTKTCLNPTFGTQSNRVIFRGFT